MDIPLPDMMRAWRERDFARGNPPLASGSSLKLWAFAARRPRLYHALAGRDDAASRAARGRARPIEPPAPRRRPGLATRDLPAPQGKTFQQLYTRSTTEGAMIAPEDARSIVIGRIRAALGVASLDRARRRRRSSAGSNAIRAAPIPARAKRSGEERVALFTDDARQARRRCAPRRSRRKRRWRRSRPISAPAICRRACAWAADPVLAALPWREAWDIERSIRTGRASRPGRVVARRRGRGRDRNLVPRVRRRQSDHARLPARGAHRPDRTRRTSSAPMRRLSTGCGRSTARARCPAPSISISGPSRTADIEQTIVRGAHGPSRLLVLILG